MSSIRSFAWALVAFAVLCAPAVAADKESDAPKAKPAARPITVVFKKNDAKVQLHDLQIGFEDRGLFGTSFSALDKLPVKTDTLELKVPLKNLARIDVVSVKKEGKKVAEVTLKLTSTDPKEDPMTVQLDSEKPLTWKATHKFADSEVTIELDKITAIILAPEK